MRKYNFLTALNYDRRFQDCPWIIEQNTATKLVLNVCLKMGLSRTDLMVKLSAANKDGSNMAE